jgi:hypothetical protein
VALLLVQRCALHVDIPLTSDFVGSSCWTSVCIASQVCFYKLLADKSSSHMFIRQYKLCILAVAAPKLRWPVPVPAVPSQVQFHLQKQPSW